MDEGLTKWRKWMRMEEEINQREANEIVEEWIKRK